MNAFKICDIKHICRSCERVAFVWEAVKQLLAAMIPQDLSNGDIITFKWPSSSYDNEMVWLLGNYCAQVWLATVNSVDTIKDEEFFGFLRFKYRSDQQGARTALDPILGLDS